MEIKFEPLIDEILIEKTLLIVNAGIYVESIYDHKYSYYPQVF